ncbi:hypothetical protein LMG18090_04118 [Ralstonia mannitolilytica]|nr:hypothetical protein LMG18090_04118 [Ralstonia mannitolilytica]
MNWPLKPIACASGSVGTMSLIHQYRPYHGAEDGAVIVRTQACETICWSFQRPPLNTSMPIFAMSTARRRRPQPEDTSPFSSARSQA